MHPSRQHPNSHTRGTLAPNPPSCLPAWPHTKTPNKQQRMLAREWTERSKQGAMRVHVLELHFSKPLCNAGRACARLPLCSQSQKLKPAPRQVRQATHLCAASATTTTTITTLSWSNDDLPHATQRSLATLDMQPHPFGETTKTFGATGVHLQAPAAGDKNESAQLQQKPGPWSKSLNCCNQANHQQGPRQPHGRRCPVERHTTLPARASPGAQNAAARLERPSQQNLLASTQ